jgi:hypothetical protein
VAAVIQGLDPWFIDKKVSPLEARAAIAVLIGHSAGSAVGGLGGVIPGVGSDLAVTATTPSASMALTVSAGAVVVPRTNQQAFVAVFAAAANIDVPAAHSTNARVDTVIVRIRDSDLGDAANILGAKGAFIEIVKGPEDGSQAPPDLSAIPSCFPLRNYQVLANALTITTDKLQTDRRVWTRAPGGVRYSLNAEARAGAYPWDLRVSSVGQVDAWDATAAAWIQMLTAGPRTSFTPVFRYPGGSGNPAGVVSLGTGGRLVGRYSRQGRMIRGHAELYMGVGGGGGSGIVTMDLPAGLTSIAGMRQRAGTVTYYHPAVDKAFTGAVWVSDSATILDIYLPASSSLSSMSPLINANPAAATAGTGSPLLSGQYTLGDNVRVWLDFEFEATT